VGTAAVNRPERRPVCCCLFSDCPFRTEILHNSVRNPALLDSVDTLMLIGLRDRVLIAVIAYSFAASAPLP
jgi:hypothetical protein